MSYDIGETFVDDERARPDREFRSNYREDEANFKTTTIWDVNDQHQLAFGYELAYRTLGRPVFSFNTDDPANLQSQNVPLKGQEWETLSHALFTEHQWRISDHWTTFLGLRYDKHDYSEWIPSPRAAVVFSPTHRDTFKLMYNRVGRRINEGNLRLLHLDGRDGINNEFDVVEFSYGRDFTDQLSSLATIYYIDQDVTQFLPPSGGGLAREETNGKTEHMGLELELSYIADNFRLIRITQLAQSLESQGPPWHHLFQNIRRAIWLWQQHGQYFQPCHQAVCPVLIRRTT